MSVGISRFKNMERTPAKLVGMNGRVQLSC